MNREKLENTSLNDTNQDALKGLEEENSDLKSELKEASMQLLQKSTELVNCKFDLQRHRLEIDVSSFFTNSSILFHLIFFCYRNLIKTFVI